MGNTFGNVDKYQYQQMLKHRLQFILGLAFELAMHVLHDANLAAQVQKFKDHINPVDNEDDSILPAGHLRHAVHRTKAAYKDKDVCFKIAIRNTVETWWWYIKLKDSKKEDDTAMIDVLDELSILIERYDDVVVSGSAREGFYLKLK